MNIHLRAGPYSCHGHREMDGDLQYSYMSNFPRTRMPIADTEHANGCPSGYLKLKLAWYSRET